MQIIELKIRNNYKLNITKWEAKKPKGVIQLVHGSLEHCERYEEMAEMFNKIGYSVIGNDHRGHGRTAKLNNEKLGHVGNGVAHKTIIADLLEVNQYIRKNNKGVPIVLLGHSWGSFLVRCLMSIKQTDYQGAILSGVGWIGQIKAAFALLILNLKSLIFYGDESRNFKLINNQTFKKFNKNFNNKKDATGLEWCSNDSKEQEKFFNDKLRGEQFSIAGFNALIGAAKMACAQRTFDTTSTKPPIFLASGTEDPVGGYGKDITKIEKKLKKQTCQFVTKKIYINQRHELHLDSEKKQYFKDIRDWMKQNKLI